VIWAILLCLGVPLWLCAAGILTIALRNRKLRTRHGDLRVRVKPAGAARWTRGHAIWVSDVFGWRGSPAAWNEELVQVVEVTMRAPEGGEARKLRRLGKGVAIATLVATDGETLEVAAASDRRDALLGPLEAVSEPA
jgi:hypothetical protein